MKASNERFPLAARAIHGGIALFFIAAWFTGEFAEAGIAGVGYWLHAISGLFALGFLGARVVYGILGPQLMRFRAWFRFDRQCWQLIGGDVRAILHGTMPKHPPHTGIAGLVQAFGLLLLAWMTLSGVLLLGFEFAAVTHDTIEIVEAVHELGESLIPVYLGLHVGAVILHSLVGHAIWRRMV